MSMHTSTTHTSRYSADNEIYLVVVLLLLVVVIIISSSSSSSNTLQEYDVATLKKNSTDLKE